MFKVIKTIHSKFKTLNFITPKKHNLKTFQMSWVDLKPLIITKLETLTGLGQKIGQVIGKQTTDVTIFPAVTLSRGNLANITIANADNKYTYTFTLLVQQEAQSMDEEDAEDVIAGVVDDIVTAFDTDFNLGGAVDFSEPVQSQDWGKYDAGQGVVMYAPLVLVFNIEKQVTYGP